MDPVSSMNNTLRPLDVTSVAIKILTSFVTDNSTNNIKRMYKL